MKVIYQPRGRANEYGELACNVYTGCTHGCKYCYVPGIFKTSPSAFARVKARIGLVDNFRRDALQLQASGRQHAPIFLCFTTDPYQPIEERRRITRYVIRIAHQAGLRVNLLTKAGPLPRRDFPLLLPGDRFGVTLTCDNEADRQVWEPAAGTIDDRIDNLARAHALGIHTWASFEPTLYPAQTLSLIRTVAPHVAEIKIGKLNHRRPPAPIDYPVFLRQVQELCASLALPYTIKEDLLRAGGQA